MSYPDSIEHEAERFGRERLRALAVHAYTALADPDYAPPGT